MGPNAFSWIIDAGTKLLSANGDKFVSLGQSWATNLLFMTAIMQAIFGWHDIQHAQKAVLQTIGRYMIAMVLLGYYPDSHPIPMVGVSFPSVMTGTGAWVAGLIDMSILDQVYANYKKMATSTEPVSIFDVTNVMAWVNYLVTVLSTSLQQGAMLCVIAIGWVAAAVGKLLGPISIALFIFPPTSRLFFNWLLFMIQYSFYPVIANAVVYVLAQFSMHFFQDYPGDYTADYIAGMLLILMVVVITNLFISFKIPAMSRDFWSGSSGLSGMLGIGGWRG